MKGLTPRQAETLAAIKTFVREHGRAPYLREVAAVRGRSMGSTSVIVARLEKKGYLPPSDDRQAHTGLLAGSVAPVACYRVARLSQVPGRKARSVGVLEVNALGQVRLLPGEERAG